MIFNRGFLYISLKGKHKFSTIELEDGKKSFATDEI